MDFCVFAADLFELLGGALPGGLGRGDVGLDARQFAVDFGEIDPAAAGELRQKFGSARFERFELLLQRGDRIFGAFPLGGERLPGLGAGAAAVAGEIGEPFISPAPVSGEVVTPAARSSADFSR